MTREAQCIRCRDELEVDQVLRDMPAQDWDLVSVIHLEQATHLYFKRHLAVVKVPRRIELIADPKDRPRG